MEGIIWHDGGLPLWNEPAERPSAPLTPQKPPIDRREPPNAERGISAASNSCQNSRTS